MVCWREAEADLHKRKWARTLFRKGWTDALNGRTLSQMEGFRSASCRPTAPRPCRMHLHPVRRIATQDATAAAAERREHRCSEMRERSDLRSNAQRCVSIAALRLYSTWRLNAVGVVFRAAWQSDERRRTRGESEQHCSKWSGVYIRKTMESVGHMSLLRKLSMFISTIGRGHSNSAKREDQQTCGLRCPFGRNEEVRHNRHKVENIGFETS